MTAIASVLKPGAQTTVQDFGRPGQRHLGVPQSGAADRVSLAFANAAVGNAACAAALECALAGPALKFERTAIFALAGAEMNATLNDAPVANYQRHDVKAGDVLEMNAASVGARAYLAIAGGVAGDDFLGSVSTYLPANLGGVDGRALRAGDVIKSAGASMRAPIEIPPALRAGFSHDWVLRATAGPEASIVDAKNLSLFFAAALAADRRGDRMGLRLTGENIVCAAAPPMKSSAVFPGTVQCPPDGAPFVLLADAQTTGGYPRVAQIIDADLNLAGQIRPGDRIWFRRVNADEARAISTQRQALLASFLPGFRRR